MKHHSIYMKQEFVLKYLLHTMLEIQYADNLYDVIHGSISQRILHLLVDVKDSSCKPLNTVIHQCDNA